jgi:hypothetical protein
MPTKDGLTNDHSLPLFLTEHAEDPEQWDIGKAWDRAVISSRILKTSILVVTATAIGVAVMSVGNPVVLLANVTASLFDTSALQPGTGQSMPTIQPTTGAQDLLPTARDEPPINPGANPEFGFTWPAGAPIISIARTLGSVSSVFPDAYCTKQSFHVGVFKAKRCS